MKPFNILFIIFILFLLLCVKCCATPTDYDKGYERGLIDGLKLSMSAIEKMFPSTGHVMQIKFVKQVSLISKKGRVK